LAEIRLQVPEFLSGLSDLGTTIPGLVAAIAPVALDYFFPGSAPLVTKIVAAATGAGLMLAKGYGPAPDMAPAAPQVDNIAPPVQELGDLVNTARGILQQLEAAKPATTKEAI